MFSCVTSYLSLTVLEPYKNTKLLITPHQVLPDDPVLGHGAAESAVVCGDQSECGAAAGEGGRIHRIQGIRGGSVLRTRSQPCR